MPYHTSILKLEKPTISTLPVNTFSKELTMHELIQVLRLPFSGGREPLPQSPNIHYMDKSIETHLLMFEFNCFQTCCHIHLAKQSVFTTSVKEWAGAKSSLNLSEVL